MTTRTYARRVSIDGLPGWTISADGTVRKWNRIQPVTKNAGGDLVVHINRDHPRLLDEIVMWAFHGPPPHDVEVPPLGKVRCGIDACTVLHADGNKSNCAADNLSWQVDEDWLERDLRRLLRPYFLPSLPPRLSPLPKTRIVVIV